MNRLFLLLVLACCAPPLQAQYPAKPLRAVVAFGTGGATDVIARIIAASMSQSLGQPVVIDNRPGADGIDRGRARSSRPRPTATRVFFATSTQISALPSLRKNVPFDPLVDLTPIGGIGNFSFFWAVHPDLPVQHAEGARGVRARQSGQAERRQLQRHRHDRADAVRRRPRSSTCR